MKSEELETGRQTVFVSQSKKLALSQTGFKGGDWPHGSSLLESSRVYSSLLDSLGHLGVGRVDGAVWPAGGGDSRQCA